MHHRRDISKDWFLGLRKEKSEPGPVARFTFYAYPAPMGLDDMLHDGKA